MLILGSKMTHLCHLGHDKNFSQKSFITFLCLLNPNFMQKIRKNSEKKALQTDGQTRGWMNRAEFTGPEG